MSNVETGRQFENKAKNIFINEGYKIIEHSSQKKWGSPFDFLLEKGGLVYLGEVRSSSTNNFSIGEKLTKLRCDKYLDKELVFLLITSKEYQLFKYKDIEQQVKISNKLIIGNFRIYTKSLFIGGDFFIYCPFCWQEIVGYSGGGIIENLIEHTQEYHKDRFNIQNNTKPLKTYQSGLKQQNRGVENKQKHGSWA